MTDELVLSRRRALGALGAFGALGALALAGCGNDGSLGGSGLRSTSSTTSGPTSPPTTTTATSGTSGGAASTTSCVLTPQETGGPYVLDMSRNQQVFRRDITEGKAGVPLRLTLAMLDVNDRCAPITNSRVDLWHCDKDGAYSGFSQPGVNTVGQTFCRGIQNTDSSGNVTFMTIYPGWYTGRITHIHFQLFLSNGKVATSQLAFPPEVTTAVYNSSLYRSRGQNSLTSFSQDGVFSDGTTGEIVAISGDPIAGYTANLNVGVAA